MITRANPADAGVRQADIDRMMQAMAEREINMHSVLMARGDKLFFEQYWAPFTAKRGHRMYSVTKSFVSVAIGCLADEGRLSLDDPIIRYFPDKLPGKVHPYLAAQTVRDMLMMCTCFAGFGWFYPEVTDRLAYYFSRKPVRPAGTVFDYDSTGSYVLGVLVERLSEMELLKYLRKKVLDRIGGFEDAEILKTPDGTSWGDSALVCTPRALLNFARFVLNRGVWEGERLVSETYLLEATTKRTDNNVEGRADFNRHGYGYQFWMTEQGGFSFNGMGGQFAICVPEKNFVFVCTGDNQLSDDLVFPHLFDAVFDNIVDHMAAAPLPVATPLPETALQLPVAHGEADSDFARDIDGAWFACDENPMGITRFCLRFSRGGEGCLLYDNAQGEKRLPFGMKKNLFGKFPQLGYSDERGNVHELTDFRYDCAASAGWIEEKKLQLKVQIIDRYFGNLVITFGFRDKDTVGVRMIKSAEDFLNEYQGWMGALRDQGSSARSFA